MFHKSSSATTKQLSIFTSVNLSHNQETIRLRNLSSKTAKSSFERLKPCIYCHEFHFRQYKFDFERPKFGFERPKFDFERPKIGFERPKITFERTKTCFERPKTGIERPLSYFGRHKTCYISDGFAT